MSSVAGTQGGAGAGAGRVDRPAIYFPFSGAWGACLTSINEVGLENVSYEKMEFIRSTLGTGGGASSEKIDAVGKAVHQARHTVSIDSPWSFYQLK